MKPLHLNLLLSILLILVFASCSNNDNELYIENKIDISINYSKMELEILGLVNDHRISKGLKTLEKMDIISKTAESHSKYMAKTGQVDHNNFPERNETLMTKANAKVIGENIGFGFTTSKGVLTGWLQSDDHRKTIEDPRFTHFGISVEQNSNGRNYFTNIFIVR